MTHAVDQQSAKDSASARLPLRPELAGEKPYGAPQLDVPVLLNVNENPYPPSEDVVATIAEEVARAARGMNRYPDREATALRQDLADYLEMETGVHLEHLDVWAANGSNEVMLHVLQAFGGPGRAALSFAPTYSMYPEYARDTHTSWVVGRREDDFTLDPAYAAETIRRVGPSVILLASPNNPTGTALPTATIEAVCEAALAVDIDGAHPVVVVDEAYAEFRRPGTPSAVALLAQYPNLAVTRTMSKAFAAAGARLGYLVASSAFVDALRIVRLPYHLSAITQAAAGAALRHRESLMAKVATLRAERDSTVAWLREQRLPDGLPFDVAETDANFVLFGTFGDRHAVWQGLLDRGVLIRETGPDGWLRVSIGTSAEMAAFRAALTEVLEEQA
ncbi:histidinol-phosphate transaminase [Promicromonospora soli]|uniref:Histidinol-phosphate aminotransferase n=1 Tax=Promicromonospora soli TaxID=2035533 RepID=A0A919FY59_9MICO|nr:histidinol-phosphate transaminase [Promicromonospora soli]GHH74059.1 histidinol-phosphate aminotransferase [Promicromonospora soli]